MLCSVGKSNSNWLDRLRYFKGFPVAGDLSLDHFLNNNSSSNATLSGSSPPLPEANQVRKSESDPEPPLQPTTEDISIEDGENEWFDIITNVLSELFNMGDSDSNQNLNFSRKKSSRKQTNPRICVLPPLNPSSKAERIDEGVAAVETIAAMRNDVYCTKNGDQTKNIVGKNVDSCLESEEDEECNGDDLLGLGYSKSEVIVIDTICASWKFDKMLFRSNDVWKVRDKKERKRKVIPTKEDAGGGNKIANEHA